MSNVTCTAYVLSDALIYSLLSIVQEQRVRKLALLVSYLKVNIWRYLSRCNMKTALKSVNIKLISVWILHSINV